MAPPGRGSVRQIRRLLEDDRLESKQTLSRSSVHRLLQHHGLSQFTGAASLPEENRSFWAEFAGSIWDGNAAHGPRVPINVQIRKTYLVSPLDDASRMVAHSVFYLGEMRCPMNSRARRCAW